MPNYDIRFIDSHYKEQFRIPDGSWVEISFPDGAVTARCKWLDEYHTQIGERCFHICQFAELLERENGTCRPETEIFEQEAAWKIGEAHYLAIQECEDGWDYTLFDQDFLEIDGGQLDEPELSIREIKDILLADIDMVGCRMERVDYDTVMEQAANVMENYICEKRTSALEQLSILKSAAPEPCKSTGTHREEAR